MTTELFFYYLKTYQFHLRFSCRGQEGSGSSQQQHMLVWKKERGHGNSDSLWVVRSWRGERCTKRQQETNEKGNKEARQQNISRGQIQNSHWDMHRIWQLQIRHCVLCWATPHTEDACAGCQQLVVDWPRGGSYLEKEHPRKRTENVTEKGKVEELRERKAGMIRQKMQSNYCTRVKGWEVHLN